MDGATGEVEKGDCEAEKSTFAGARGGKCNVFRRSGGKLDVEIGARHRRVDFAGSRVENPAPTRTRPRPCRVFPHRGHTLTRLGVARQGRYPHADAPGRRLSVRPNKP